MRCTVSFPSIHRMGGIERVGLELANQIAKAGHDSAVVAYDVDESSLHQGVEVRKITRPKGPGLLQSIRFPKLAEQAVYHQCDGPPDISFGLGALAPRNSVVWVTSVHARWLDVASRPPFSGSLKRKLNPFHPVMLRQERRAFGTPYHAHLMAMAQNVVDDLQRFYQVPEERISVVPHGYDTTQFSLERAEQLRGPARERWGIQPEDRVVLCVANEIPRKGLPQLMQAISKMDAKPRLLVAGRISESALKEAGAQANLPDSQLIAAGVVKDVAEAVAACDVMALPTFYDSWGLVIIEALACGKPVVTTQLAGASQVVKNQSNGIVIEHPQQIDALHDALVDVLNWEDRSEICATSVEHLIWENVIDQVITCGARYSN